MPLKYLYRINQKKKKGFEFLKFKDPVPNADWLREQADVMTSSRHYEQDG